MQVNHVLTLAVSAVEFDSVPALVKYLCGNNVVVKQGGKGCYVSELEHWLS